MRYTIHTGENYIDTLTLKQLLQMEPSKLKREMGRYFTTEDYIKYNNKHLYKETAVVDFICHLLLKNIEGDKRKNKSTSHEI